MRISTARVVHDLTDLRNDLDTAIREHKAQGHVSIHLLTAEDTVKELISYLRGRDER